MREEERTQDAAQKLTEALVQFRRLKNVLTREPGPPAEGRFRHSEVLILFILEKVEHAFPEGVSISELSHFLRVKSPTVTPTVFLLEKMHMVRRSTDQRDRRVIRIQLTDEGRRLILQHKERFTARIQGLVAYLGEEKSNTLAELLNEVYAYASGLSEPKK